MKLSLFLTLTETLKPFNNKNKNKIQYFKSFDEQDSFCS